MGSAAVAFDPAHMCQPKQRWGDLLPLPLPARRDAPTPGSRSAKRRLQRSSVSHREESGTVVALNSLAGFEDPSSWPLEPLHQAHSSALEQIRKAHSHRVWPREGNLRPRAALSQLLRSSAAYGAAAGSLSLYEPGHVSLPSDQREPCPIVDVLDERSAFEVAHFEYAQSIRN